MLAKSIEIDFMSFSEKKSVSIHVDFRNCILFHDIPEKRIRKKGKEQKPYHFKQRLSSMLSSAAPMSSNKKWLIIHNHQ